LREGDWSGWKRCRLFGLFRRFKSLPLFYDVETLASSLLTGRSNSYIPEYMKFLLKIIACLFLWQLLPGCNWNIKLPEDEPERLFLFGYMHPDSVISIRVTHSFGLSALSNTVDAAVKSVSVKVFENDLLLDSLLETSPGMYQSGHSYKPIQGRSYYFTAEATGFQTVRTLPDSIPPPLPVASVSADYVPTQENFAALTLAVHLARPVSDDLLGIQFHYFSTFVLDSGYVNRCIGNRTLVCDRLSVGAFVNEFCLEDFYCVSQFEDITLYTPELSFYDGSPARLSLATFSQRSIELAYKTGLSSDTYTNNYEVNPFYSPVFLPIEVEGGYAAIYFYNTYNRTLQF